MAKRKRSMGTIIHELYFIESATKVLRKVTLIETNVSIGKVFIICGINCG